MIPDANHAAVCRGLNETFGTTTIDDISGITTGLSSDLKFRIVVKGLPFLLRIMTRMDERNDPKRVFACMDSAAAAGLAPRVLYSSVDDGVAIIDWIESMPMSQTEALAEVPATLRKLHALPPFPTTFNYTTAHRYFIWRLRTSGLLPVEETEELFRSYDRICARYPRLDADLVSSHMDLKPENVLFDGSRIWLVDWQAASINDRYFDLAIVGNFVIHDDVDECAYLKQYFGQTPDEYQLARFFLMRQVMHMLAASVFLVLGASGQPIPANPDLPWFRDFHDAIWAGEIDLARKDLQVVYGLIHWRQLMRNVRQSRFEDALKIVAARNTDDTALLLPIYQ